MSKRILVLLLFACLSAFPAVAFAQTYYYEGGSISTSDLRRARPYKKGTYLVQSGKNRGVIWIPKHDARGNRWLELMMEHFLQGAQEIRDYAPVQIGTIVGGSHGTASVMALLMDPEAREMLKVSKEQGEKLNDAFSVFRKQLGDRMKEFQRTTPKASTLQTVLFRTSEIERLSITLQQQLERILSTEQIRRSKEIVFQLYGGFRTPVVDLEILSLFDLSREQREKLELIAEDANQKRNRIFEAKENVRLGASDMQSFDMAMADVASVIGRKVREVLDEKQLERGDRLTEQSPEVKKLLGLTDN